MKAIMIQANNVRIIMQLDLSKQYLYSALLLYASEQAGILSLIRDQRKKSWETREQLESCETREVAIAADILVDI